MNELSGPSDRPAEPDGERRLRRPRLRRRMPHARQGVDRRSETAARPAILLAPDQDRVDRWKGGGGHRLRLPAGLGVPEALVAAEGGHVPSSPVGREPADVLVGEQGQRRVRRTARRRADGVPDGGPVLPVVGRDLEAVRRGDDGRVAPHDDSVGNDVLPLRTELLEGPVPPASAPVDRESPAVPHRAVPDLVPRTEGDGLHEIHRDGRAGRVPAEALPGVAARRQAENALSVGADPESARRVARGGEDVDAPAGAVRKGRKRRWGRLGTERAGGDQDQEGEKGRTSEHRIVEAKVRVRSGRGAASRSARATGEWRRRGSPRPRQPVEASWPAAGSPPGGRDRRGPTRPYPSDRETPR